MVCQKWPKHITVVSHDFKKRRFVGLHCPAIRWPVDKFTFTGIDPPEDVVSRGELMLGENNRGYGAFERDPYGAHTSLKAKREKRGWTAEKMLNMCHSGIPSDVKLLVLWEGGETGTELFGGPLPWTH